MPRHPHIFNGPITIRLVDGPFVIIAATPEGGVIRHFINQPAGTNIHQTIHSLEEEHHGLPFMIYQTDGEHPLGRHHAAGLIDGIHPPVRPNYALTKQLRGQITLVLARSDDWFHISDTCENWAGVIRIHRWDGHAFVQIRERTNPVAQ